MLFGSAWCLQRRQCGGDGNGRYDAVDPDADAMKELDSQTMYRESVQRRGNGTAAAVPMDIVDEKSGLHIVNDYSDASRLGGLLPLPVIAEERSKQLKKRTGEAKSDGESEALVTSLT